MPNPVLNELCSILPPIEALARKVSGVHGPGDPRLYEVRDLLCEAARNLRELAQGDTPAAGREVAAKLVRLRELTDGFTPPARACGSYRALLDSLDELDQSALPLLG